MDDSSTDRARPARTRAAGFVALAAPCALAALCGLAACGAPALKGPLLLHPAPPPAEARDYALVQGAVVFSGPDFSVSARPWDYRLVAREFAGAGGPSPFGEGEEAAGRFLFFRVRLENRSTRTLVFNPMRSSLVRQGETPLVALENSDLFAFAGDDLAVAEARSRVFRRASFDVAATVRPGETLERYLVFPSPEETAKEMALVLDDLWLGSASYDLRFAFEAYPGK